MRRMSALLAAVALLAGGCSRLVSVETLPIGVQAAAAPEQSLVYAADGSLLATWRLEHRENVALADLPQPVVDAVLAAEDRHFYAHRGVDARAVVRAAIANRRAGTVVQGGSTITQQLVKNRYFPNAADTLQRKAQEARLAVELERTTSKDAILTDYLNTVYFGAGAYGIQAAARTYFGVDAAALSIPQAALLAGLLRAPEAASPYRAPERARAERGRVVAALVETGRLTRWEADQVDRTPLGVRPAPPAPGTRFPYFVEYVRRTLLADPAFGPDAASRVARLYGGGLRIRTTLDPALQAKAEAVASTFPSGPGAPEVALAVVRPSDGAVVALVGGRDFATRQFDLATQGRRQPGSTFKAFALVAALRAGMDLEDRIEGGSGVFRRGAGAEPWRVRSAQSGSISLRDAVATSSNGAFARLALRLGARAIADQARAMGITSDTGTDEAIVLGGIREGVSPLEMAGAFATLANSGVHVPPAPVTTVEDDGGRVIWRATPEVRVAVDPEVAWFATQALRDVVERGTGTAARLDRPAAGKTGTSQRNSDAWFVGYTPELAAAVWIGHPDAERPLVGIGGEGPLQGGGWPARLWGAFMAAALDGLPVQDFRRPQEVTVTVDPTTGGLATQWCPFTVPLTGLPRELPTFFCPLHQGPPPSPPPSPSPSPPPTSPSTDAAAGAPSGSPTPAGPPPGDGAASPSPTSAEGPPPQPSPQPAPPPQPPPSPPPPEPTGAPGAEPSQSASPTPESS